MGDSLLIALGISIAVWGGVEAAHGIKVLSVKTAHGVSHLVHRKPKTPPVRHVDQQGNVVTDKSEA